jgi:hypothetical protein
MICWIFGHKYNPEKWDLIGEAEVYKSDASKRPISVFRKYSNTCTKCGDIVFRDAKLIQD